MQEFKLHTKLSDSMNRIHEIIEVKGELLRLKTNDKTGSKDGFLLTVSQLNNGITLNQWFLIS